MWRKVPRHDKNALINTCNGVTPSAGTRRRFGTWHLLPTCMWLNLDLAYKQVRRLFKGGFNLRIYGTMTTARNPNSSLPYKTVPCNYSQHKHLCSMSVKMSWMVDKAPEGTRGWGWMFSSICKGRGKAPEGNFLKNILERLVHKTLLRDAVQQHKHALS